MGNCIVCDIQPMYEKYLNFDIRKFTRFLNNQNRILFFYVGNEDFGIVTDTKEDVLQWLLEHGLKESTAYRIRFIDKGYGFFRDLMDSYSTLDDLDLIKIIKYLQDNDLNSIDEIKSPDDLNSLGLEGTQASFCLPYTFNIKEFSGFEKAKMVGGCRTECLKELELYLKANDFEYKLFENYVY